MARWIGLGALALASATFAIGQSPAPPPPPAPTAAAGPRVGEVMTFRTSGQPERRVRIVKIIGTPETDGLADVQDLGTGAKYSLPLKIVGMMARASFSETPATADPAAPGLNPGTASALPGVARTLPSAPPAAGENGWPTSAPPAPASALAKPRPAPPSGRPADPRAALPPPTNVRNLMRPETPPPRNAAPVAARPTPPTTPAPPTFTLTQRPKMDSPATAARTTPPAVTVESSPAAEVREVAVAFRPPPSVAVEVVESRVVVAALAGRTADAPTESSGVRSPRVTIAPPEYVVVPVLEYSPPPPPETPKPAPAPAPPAPVPAPPAPVPDRFGPPPVTPLDEPRAATPAAIAAPLPPPAPLPTPVVLASRVEPPAPVAEPLPRPGVPAQMLEEVQPFVNELFQALRPSLRERAATALAEGRYGSRAEVKATLAQAALTDPAPSVRAHCIAQLARLGYHEASYLAYLDACAESGHTTVKQAATAALTKLASRN